MKDSDIQKAMKEKASYGQFHSEGITHGGWFIWLMDAVDVAKGLMDAVDVAKALQEKIIDIEPEKKSGRQY